MELNKEDIIKALECCKSFRDFYACDECPYSHTMLADDESCTNRMSQDALSLINELTAENKLLNVELGNASSEILRLIDREKELTEENETLTLKVAAYQVKDKLLSNQLDDKCDMCIARERADTVRKMQDKLAQYIGTYTDKSFVYVKAMFKLIDRIAEEIINGSD